MNQAETVKQIALAIPEQAKALLVIDNETYHKAGALLQQIKGLRREIQIVFRPMKEAATKAHKAVLEQERQADAPLIQAERIIKPALAAWDTAQELARRQEERRLQELARKQEEDRKLAEAVALEQAGDSKEADQVMAEPVVPPPVVVAKTVPKIQGVSFTERWQFEIQDVLKIPRVYLKPDEVKIGAYVRAMKGASMIPGVRVWTSKSVSGRA